MRLIEILATAYGHLAQWRQGLRAKTRRTPAASALPRSERLCYRPQICCDTGMVASLRTVPPPHMEGDADAVLRLALRQSREWQAAGQASPTMVIDIPRDMAECARLAEPLIWEIDRQEADKHRVMFSAPPSRGRSDPLDGLLLLSRFGCAIEMNCLDQPGLRLLENEQPDLARLRIPQAFFRDCDSDPHCGKHTLAMLSLAEQYRADSLAEGVDTREEHGFLAQIGCSVVEGAAVAPVLDANATAHFLRATSAAPRQNAIPRPAA
ncbi:EAL domain-containing protein [Paracoccus sediminicola]|uniref:EAL domain-containing protein n=1 Tax=Paracoccus sediminicola TaxID=3017783 RepID=UPI0022F0A80A|nr:EAL domain-containing protein [Paracoccus sediminicola]WBU55746.1 EAL domain-containing protein [Paracoccus sediminicola]